MNDLDDRLHALGELLEDGDPMPKATIERRAARLRQRRLVIQAVGAVAASLAVVAGSAAMLTRDDNTNDVSTNSPPPDEEPTTTAPETTLPTTTSTDSTTTSTESETPTEPVQVAGDLPSATTALRAACREFYDFVADDNQTTGTSILAEPELANRCDSPAPEFRSDCYAERPATFVPGEGGCAVLYGHLALYYGEPPDSSDYANDPRHRFAVGDDVWWIYPESD